MSWHLTCLVWYGLYSKLLLEYYFSSNVNCAECFIACIFQIWAPQSCVCSHLPIVKFLSAIQFYCAISFIYSFQDNFLFFFFHFFKASLESIRDSLAEELVKMTAQVSFNLLILLLLNVLYDNILENCFRRLQCEKLRAEASVLPGIRAELDALRRRHSAALELMGERDEEVHISLVWLFAYSGKLIFSFGCCGEACIIWM